MKPWHEHARVASGRTRTLIGALFLAVLTGCGGGGGGGQGGGDRVGVLVDVPQAPTLSVTPEAIKQLRFDWTLVPGAESYVLWEAPAPGDSFVEVQRLGAGDTSTRLTVFLPLRVQARYRLQACNAAGCADGAEVPVVGSLAEAVGYVKASNTDPNDEFGTAIALSGDGNTLAVGAISESSNAIGVGGTQTDNSALYSGAVYVFTRIGAVWSQQAYLKASNTGMEDYFGRSVALSHDGGTLAVGASQEDSNATGVDGTQTDNSVIDSGAVYVFARTGASWSQQAYVKASNAQAGDDFGARLALSGDGNTLAVGAYGEDSNALGVGGDQTDNSTRYSGAVYVFSRAAGAWSQQAYVKASNTESFDGFGTALALSGDGNTLAVGAEDEESSAVGVGGSQTDNSATGSGAVYVFSRSAGVWSQQAYVKASNTGTNDRFGTAVALSGDGNTLAVGAWGEDSGAVGLNGDQTDNGTPESGAAYVFTRAAGMWSQQAYVKASNTGTNDRFGESVSLSRDGNSLAVGAAGESSSAVGVGGSQTDNSALGSGAVYVFTRAAGTWRQKAFVKASNTDAEDGFGFPVALSGDGHTLAVSARREASNAVGVGGNQADNSTTSIATSIGSLAAGGSGAVYVY